MCFPPQIRSWQSCLNKIYKKPKMWNKPLYKLLLLECLSYMLVYLHPGVKSHCHLCLPVMKYFFSVEKLENPRLVLHIPGSLLPLKVKKVILKNQLLYYFNNDFHCHWSLVLLIVYYFCFFMLKKIEHALSADYLLSAAQERTTKFEICLISSQKNMTR